MALITLGNPTTTSQVDLDNDVIQLNQNNQFSGTSTLYTFVDNDNSTILIDGTALMSGSGLDPAMVIDGDSSGIDMIISDTGRIVSTQSGVENDANGTLIQNAGEIHADNVAIQSSGVDLFVRNTGIISGTDAINSQSSLYLENTGQVSAFSVGVRASILGNLTNSGSISGLNAGVSLFSGSFLVQNLAGGVISSDAIAVAIVTSGDMSVDNSGTISGGTHGVAADNADLVLVNSGVISTTQNDAITTTTSGEMSVFNTGTIASGNGIAIDAAQATVVDIVNTGEIIGDLILAGGDDTVLNAGQGVISGEIRAGNGNDTLIGGDSAEAIDGEADNDYISGGDGDDAITTGGGVDIALGGAGDDTITVNRGGTKFLLGQSGADTFIFLDDGVSPPGGEITSILDFEQGTDIIDFYAIASGIAFVGDAGFSAIGGAEIATKEIGGAITLAQLDANGDGTAELEILVYGAVDMTREDFGL
jgi:hypothetical protein